MTDVSHRCRDLLTSGLTSQSVPDVGTALVSLHYMHALAGTVQQCVDNELRASVAAIAQAVDVKRTWLCAGVRCAGVCNCGVQIECTRIS